MAPSIASAWPTIYLVAAWIDTSAPWANDLKKSAVAQVLSSTTSAPAACAAAAMAGMSCTSKVWEPGNSVNTSLVFSDQVLNAGAYAGVVIGGLDAQPLQHVVAKAARGAIDAIADEHLVTGRDEREEGGGDGGKTRGGEQRGVAALELGDRLLQRPDRGRAEPSIGEFLVVGFEARDARKQHGRAPIDRGIDKSVKSLWFSPGMGEPRVLLLSWWPLAHRL